MSLFLMRSFNSYQCFFFLAPISALLYPLRYTVLDANTRSFRGPMSMSLSHSFRATLSLLKKSSCTKGTDAKKIPEQANFSSSPLIPFLFKSRQSEPNTPSNEKGGKLLNTQLHQYLHCCHAGGLPNLTLRRLSSLSDRNNQ